MTDKRLIEELKELEDVPMVDHHKQAIMIARQRIQAEEDVYMRGWSDGRVALAKTVKELMDFILTGNKDASDNLRS